MMISQIFHSKKKKMILIQFGRNYFFLMVQQKKEYLHLMISLGKANIRDLRSEIFDYSVCDFNIKLN